MSVMTGYHYPDTREKHLERVVAFYFAKRHHGAYYKSAVRIAIRDLKDERGDR